MEWGRNVPCFSQTGMNKILVIEEIDEDDEQVRDSVSLSLESAGYVVMEASTRQEDLQTHKQFGASGFSMGKDRALRSESKSPS
jgi:hypothetical protein